MPQNSETSQSACNTRAPEEMMKHFRPGNIRCRANSFDKPMVTYGNHFMHRFFPGWVRWSSWARIEHCDKWPCDFWGLASWCSYAVMQLCNKLCIPRAILLHLATGALGGFQSYKKIEKCGPQRWESSIAWWILKCPRPLRGICRLNLADLSDLSQFLFIAPVIRV